MKPGEHPEFYQIAPPPGTSRESTIVLDREGRFCHESERVENRALEMAMRSWISRHPDNGRLILDNGYDWCYFRAEGAPFIVDALRLPENDREPVILRLFDGSEERLDPQTLSQDKEGIVYARVRNSTLEARFSRHAQTELMPLVKSAEPPTLHIEGCDYILSERQ